MSDKGEPPPTRRKPPDRRPSVLDRPLMERDLLAPDKSRVLPAYSQIPRRKGSPPATGVALGASGAEPPPIAKPAPLPRRNIASRRCTPPELEEEDLQEEKRLKAGSDSVSESASASTSASTSKDTPTPPRKQPVTRHNSPPESPYPTTSPTCMQSEMQDFGEQYPEGEKPSDSTS
ncbi:unnamed protein product [Parnassius apollo]|uniref:(apollo) hypothetical protein n=1 Tax=Parnassius apollo TaxID=110799 RepID=A0A8S3W5L1_PARAO|nr:unnamed protein product [Parnassius apollo]